MVACHLWTVLLSVHNFSILLLSCSLYAFREEPLCNRKEEWQVSSIYFLVTATLSCSGSRGSLESPVLSVTSISHLKIVAWRSRCRCFDCHEIAHVSIKLTKQITNKMEQRNYVSTTSLYLLPYVSLSSSLCWATMASAEGAHVYLLALLLF